MCDSFWAELSIDSDARYRAPVLLGIFGSLRWGELAALRRRDIDLDGSVVHVRNSLTEPSSGDGLVFTSPGGKPLRQSNFRRRMWAPALAAVGLSGVHFHDRRHTGNTLSEDLGVPARTRIPPSGTPGSAPHWRSIGTDEQARREALTRLRGLLDQGQA